MAGAQAALAALVLSLLGCAEPADGAELIGPNGEPTILEQPEALRPEAILISTETLNMRLEASEFVEDASFMEGQPARLTPLAWSQVVYLDENTALLSGYCVRRTARPVGPGPDTEHAGILVALTRDNENYRHWNAVFLRVAEKFHYGGTPREKREYRRIRKLAMANEQIKSWVELY